MALEPIDELHALQIQAGVLGRRTGHMFEDAVAAEINATQYPRNVENLGKGHVYIGNPAISLLDYIARANGKPTIKRAIAISTGALATSEEGVRWLHVNGMEFSKCKSDLVVTFEWLNGETLTAGISSKQCNNKTPTNAQLYFTTAQGFANLLNRNDIAVSSAAISALKQFCGDIGYRPLDDVNLVQARLVDPRRWFWEEVERAGREEWSFFFPPGKTKYLGSYCKKLT